MQRSVRAESVLACESFKALESFAICCVGLPSFCVCGVQRDLSADVIHRGTRVPGSGCLLCATGNVHRDFCNGMCITDVYNEICTTGCVQRDAVQRDNKTRDSIRGYQLCKRVNFLVRIFYVSRIVNWSWLICYIYIYIFFLC
jgi:hypothetical protein